MIDIHTPCFIKAKVETLILTFFHFVCLAMSPFIWGVDWARCSNYCWSTATNISEIWEIYLSPKMTCSLYFWGVGGDIISPFFLPPFPMCHPAKKCNLKTTTIFSPQNLFLKFFKSDLEKCKKVCMLQK